MRKEGSPVEGGEDWILFNPELSLSIWKAMEATAWRHLPFPGNLLDQPEWWIHDAFTLAWRKQVLRQELETEPLRRAVGKRRVAFGG